MAIMPAMMLLLFLSALASCSVGCFLLLATNRLKVMPYMIFLKGKNSTAPKTIDDMPYQSSYNFLSH